MLMCLDVVDQVVLFLWTEQAECGEAHLHGTLLSFQVAPYGGPRNTKGFLGHSQRHAVLNSLNCCLQAENKILSVIDSVRNNNYLYHKNKEVKLTLGCVCQCRGPTHALSLSLAHY